MLVPHDVTASEQMIRTRDCGTLVRPDSAKSNGMCQGRADVALHRKLCTVQEGIGLDVRAVDSVCNKRYGDSEFPTL